jgi:two-component system, OmpR family, response regulator QseB
MLPRLDGISLCQQLRTSGYTGFVLMLTARDTTTDKVVGLDAGADDYLVKPFELEELSARIRALSRRSLELRQMVLRCGPLEINPTLHKAMYAENSLNLTPKEYLILECFLRNPGQVFTRSMLLDKLWGLDQFSGENTFRTHITNLRQKLKAAGSPAEIIQTVYGVGYRLVQG